jgi:hypothetical protein
MSHRFGYFCSRAPYLAALGLNTRMTSHLRPNLEPWIDSYLRKRYPELERPLLDAVQAYDEMDSSAIVDPTRLKPLLDAASSARAPLYENATHLLGDLAVIHEAARHAVIEMASNSTAQVRFNAILCVDKAAPRSFALHVVRNGLTDGSARVREKAADWAYRCSLHELTPDLVTALQRESNANAKSCIGFALEKLSPAHSNSK